MFLLAVLLAGDYRRLISCLAVEAVTAPFGVLLSRGCNRLIYCFAAWRPTLSYFRFCCVEVLLSHSPFCCDWLCFSLHVLSLSYEVQLGGLDDTKRVSHSLFIVQIPNSLSF